jgi:hypothetical protein
MSSEKAMHDAHLWTGFFIGLVVGFTVAFLSFIKLAIVVVKAIGIGE